MVSKMTRKTPTKPIKPPPRRRRTPSKPSPSTRTSTRTSSIVIATLNDSFFTCRRKLVKIFSKLAKITTTPKKKSPLKHTKVTPIKKRTGFIRLPKLEPNTAFSDTFLTPTPDSSPLLPLLSDPDRKTVFLDLDETLIHSKPEPKPARYDFVIQPTIEGETMTFYVLKRPGVDEFLKFLSSRFEVVIFTAGLKEYASLVLDELDTNRVISYRLYRDSCREVDGKFVKDLGRSGRDLGKAVIVDDNPGSYAFQPENAIRIAPFVDDLEDGELGKLVKFFEACDEVKDIRDAVKLFAHQQNHHDLS